MTDREKVIKGLECLIANDVPCDNCHYNVKGNYCISSIAKDALVLLKEQEAIIEKYRKADGFLTVHGWKWEGGEAE